MSEKIKKNAQYEDYIKESRDSIDYDGAIEIDSLDKNSVNISKDIFPYTEELINAKFDLDSIEDYKEKVEEKEREAKIQEEKVKEEAKKIESPIDLSDADYYMLGVAPEKRVNFKRTFGVSSTRKRKIEKISTIILFAIFGLAIILFAILKTIL